MINSYMYDPFGNVIHETTMMDSPFTYNGKWGVLAVRNVPGLYYMRARCYDAEHGRFLSVDPIGFEGRSKNLYAYAYNNPVHFNDPKGTILVALFFPNPIRSSIISTIEYTAWGLATGTFTWGGKKLLICCLTNINI